MHRDSWERPKDYAGFPKEARLMQLLLQACLSVSPSYVFTSYLARAQFDEEEDRHAVVSALN